MIHTGRAQFYQRPVEIMWRRRPSNKMSVQAASTRCQQDAFHREHEYSVLARQLKFKNLVFMVQQI